MIEINTRELGKYLIRLYEKKVPAMLYGGYGIGKSEITYQVSEVLAERRKRKFIDWNRIDHKQKMECIANPSKYFVFHDMRLSQMEPSDIRGIPNLEATSQSLEVLPWSWVIYFTQADADGQIFLDEINLAPPAIAAAGYQMINDRVIADRPISPHVHILAAGNRAKDRAFTFEMPAPLKDRLAELEVVISVDGWFDWAMTKGGISPHIIAFIKWKESFLHKIDEKNKDMKSVTPRGVVRASRLIDGLDILNDSMVHSLVSMSVGEAFATQFQAYCKFYRALDWKKIYKDPKYVNGLSTDQMFAVCGGLVERQVKEDSVTHLNQILHIVMEMPADFGMIVLTQLNQRDRKKFGQALQSEECEDIFDKISTKYAHLLS